MKRFHLLIVITSLIGFITPSVNATDSMAPTQILIKNVHVWDGSSDGITKKISVLIEDNLIKKLRASDSDANGDATVIDGGGRVLIPGRRIKCCPKGFPSIEFVYEDLFVAAVN